MNKAQWMITAVLIVHASGAWATPPQTLELSYNQDKQLLTVSGSHPTQDRLEHFIRRIRVTVNQNEPVTTYLTRQDSPGEFKAVVALNAQPGDTVKIEAFCNQGGGKEQILQIPKAVVTEVEPVDPAANLKAIKDRDHQTLPIIP